MTEGKEKPPKQWRAEQCIAICDYQAHDITELSFHKGDIISVTGKRGDASGFWEGITTGVNVDIMTGKKNKAIMHEQQQQLTKKSASAAVASKGLFPTCMISSNMRAVNEPKFCDKVLAVFNYKPRASEEMELEKGDVITMTRPSTSPGWWYGVKESNGSRVPEKAMAGPTAGSVLSSPASRKQERLVPLNFVTAKIVVGGLACQGNAMNELPFSHGDVIQVIRRWNDGWWEGTLRGKRGIFPSNLVHPNVSTTVPSLFCCKCKSILSFSSARDTSGSCSECAESDMVVSKMMENLVRRKQELEEGGGGVSSRLDLFAGIDLELMYGKKMAGELRKGIQTVTDGNSGPLLTSPLDTAAECTTVRRFQT